MPKTIEFQGKTVEKALESASAALKIPENEIQYEIVTYGSTGIFGLIGIKKAIIKINIENNSTDQHNEKSLRFLEDDIKNFVKKTLEGKDEVFNKSEAIKTGLYVLEQIVSTITDDTSIKISKHNQQIFFEIRGGASGVLIGKKGQTLEAIQYIIEKIINKNSSKRIRVLIDVEEYLKKKKENLQRLSTKLVDKVRRTKKPVTIGQMNANDRRIVHTHLKNEYDIRTQSIGSGYYRKLMILPQKNKKQL